MIIHSTCGPCVLGKVFICFVFGKENFFSCFWDWLFSGDCEENVRNW